MTGWRILAALVACAASVAVPTSAHAACANRVACENALLGDPQSDWLVAGAGDPALQGYAARMSVSAGQFETFKVDDRGAGRYHVDILRLGFYGGLGARKVAAGLPARVQAQSACAVQPGTGLVDCGAWLPSASWRVPPTAVSGLYVAHLVREDNHLGSNIPFVVRDDVRHSALLFQTSDETWQAYNTYGGNSLYQCTADCPPGDPKAYKGASKVSYNRPWHSAADDDGASWFTYAEWPTIRFLEQRGYDVSYVSGLDVSTRPASLLRAKAFLSVGHDEYWSRQQRENVYAARNAGVSLAFLSGNEIFWKTRFEDGGRTLVCYKDTHYDARVDPVEWTGTWRDPRFRPAAEVVPENNLTGQYFLVNSGTTDITVPARYRDASIWRNTAVARLPDGGSLTLSPGTGTLGYEWDVTPDNGYSPPGLTYLSETVNTDAEVFTDWGSTVAAHQAATHHLTEYRAPSGALVFGAGTVQWAWGLYGPGADPTMQVATSNVLADMGVTGL